MTKAFALNFSLKALFFASLDYKKRLPKLVRQPLFILRSDRDSNSGNGFAVYTLSRRASSATRAPLRIHDVKKTCPVMWPAFSLNVFANLGILSGIHNRAPIFCRHI